MYHLDAIGINREIYELTGDASTVFSVYTPNNCVTNIKNLFHFFKLYCKCRRYMLI